jgi:hypothetical protein
VVPLAPELVNSSKRAVVRVLDNLWHPGLSRLWLDLLAIKDSGFELRGNDLLMKLQYCDSIASYS